MSNYVNRLREQRDQEWAAAKRLLDTAELARRDLTAAEQQAFDAHNRHLDEIDQRVTDIDKQEQRGRDADAAFERLGVGTGRRQVDSTLRALLNGEVRGLDLDLAGVHEEVRDLTKGSATAGGNTVPTSFVARLYEHIIATSAVRRTNVEVLTTSSGENLVMPKTTAHSTAALTAEAATITESDPTFGNVTLSAFKYAVAIKASNELLTDTGVDLTGYLAKQTGRALGNASGAHFITGTGSGQPQGVITGSSAGVTGSLSVTGAFTADNLIDLYFSVLPEYRAQGYWLMSDTALAAVRKLKDTANNYLFVPNNSGGPDLLLGRPIVTDPNVAAPGLSAKSVAFGDFGGFVIRDAGSIRFERSEDVQFMTDETVFRAIQRTDSKVIDSSAVRYFTGGAS